MLTPTCPSDVPELGGRGRGWCRWCRWCGWCRWCSDALPAPQMFLRLADQGVGGVGGVLGGVGGVDALAAPQMFLSLADQGVVTCSTDHLMILWRNAERQSHLRSLELFRRLEAGQPAGGW